MSNLPCPSFNLCISDLVNDFHNQGVSVAVGGTFPFVDISWFDTLLVSFMHGLKPMVVMYITLIPPPPPPHLPMLISAGVMIHHHCHLQYDY